MQQAESGEEALKTYEEIMSRRERSYMSHTRDGADNPDVESLDSDDEGYAGVALGCVKAIARANPTTPA